MTSTSTSEIHLRTAPPSSALSPQTIQPIVSTRIHSYFFIAGWTKDAMSSTQKDLALRNLINKRFMSTASTPMRHTFSGDFGI